MIENVQRRFYWCNCHKLHQPWNLFETIEYNIGGHDIDWIIMWFHQRDKTAIISRSATYITYLNRNQIIFSHFILCFAV